MTPTFFTTASELRAWLTRNHVKATEILLGFYKVSSGKTGITYQEALDEALCFGWIDGVRKSLGDESYTIRFTPRKPRSIWSAVNIKRMNMLIELGRVKPEGLAAFSRKDESAGTRYSYEQNRALSADDEKQLRANKKAWAFFSAQPPGYRKTASWWVMSAKKQETRAKRLAVLIDDSEHGRRIALLARPSKETA
ncbi:MAG: YdeI/OmpD-associated family protein [Myxococcota bacterium]